MTHSPAVLHPLLAARRSSRAFDSDRAVPDATLVAVLEAARWAPSANNSQPWRFGLVRRGEPAFAAVAATLAPGNQVWARSAAAFVLLAVETADEAGNARRWAVYDAGQAAAHLTVQAQAEGLMVHQMGGFDPDAAREVFALPERMTPLVVVALGFHDPEVELPEPFASRELAPRVRAPLEDILLTPASDALPLSA